MLQAAFFKLADVIPIEDAVKYMKEAVVKTYSRKGQKIVDMNLNAIDEGLSALHKVEIPEPWKTADDCKDNKPLVGRNQAQTDYLNDVLIPYGSMSADDIPVSKFTAIANGMIPSGTAAFEKRGIATDIPVWNKDNCMQCNWCSYSCPHGVIRPFVLNNNEAEAEELQGEFVAMKGSKDYLYAIGISALDCTGCGSCQQVCPARTKALEMVPSKEDAVEKAQARFDYLFNQVEEKKLPQNMNALKASQFRQPLLEFSGACPGCGETPYAKLVTQLFGDRMFIANATGCSSIWGCSAPSTPYTVNKQGRGPAWANSLFEDNAEFGLGMTMSMKARRKEIETAVERLVGVIGEEAKEWLASKNDAAASEATGKALVDKCEGVASANEDAKYVIENKNMLIKPSMWIFGGDGWAYDIGYGGLDHVIASGENVNVLVFDTEVYSNTGGQSSKSTPLGAAAKFAASGKKVKKKDLAQIAMAYGYVYVAQIAMGANPAQTLKAIKEAEAYDGPSLIIAYAPCINHGLKSGMNKAMLEMKKAVDSGYWTLLRYNPQLREEGKNPLSVDSPMPTESYESFLAGEERYDSLRIKFPETADKLFKEAERLALDRYEELVNRQKTFDRIIENEGKSN